MNYNSKSYILGFMTLALGYYLGSIWSPDYYEFMNNGANHLFILGFGVLVLLMELSVDFFYKMKQKQGGGE